jgi:hypothetical protein
VPSEPSFIRSLLERQVELSRGARVVLALVVLAGGSAFALLGGALLLRPGSPFHPLGAAVLSAGLAGLGVGMCWLGLRLVRLRSAAAVLLSPRARRRISLGVGLLGVGMFALALQSRSAEAVLVSTWLVCFSYFLYPVEA